MLKKLIPIAATFVVTAIAVTFVVMSAESTAQDTDPGLPYNDNGTWTPEYFPVSDSEGNTVGVVRSADTFGEDSMLPHPVYSVGDNRVQVGWMGERGYWALGEKQAWCTECVLTDSAYSSDGSSVVVTETYNEDYTITRTTTTTDSTGDTITAVETIEAGTDGPPGPTGSVND